MKIGRNDKCPCGSGQKFKYCCQTEELLKMRLRIRDIKKIKDENKIKECLFPDHTSCSDKIIKAHSIQNNKILQKISDDGKVYMPISKKMKIFQNMSSWGRKEATTFTGFCGYHDNEIFKEIENNNFDYSERQKFLYVYRAFALEYHRKRENIKFERQVMKKFDNGT